MSTAEFVNSFFKTSEELVTETTSLLQTNNYIDFLTQEEITYLRLQIQIHTHSDGAPFKMYHTIPAMYMTIMNKLLNLAQYKYMLAPSIVTQLQKTMNLKAILQNIDAYIRSKLVESANYSGVFTLEEISQLDQIDTYTLGRTLRTRLLEDPDYGQQLPIQIRSYLETIDPYIVLAFIDKFLSLSAEGIDIVIQPKANLFGFLHNGPLHPLYKMALELYMIGLYTSDDKSIKRQRRLDFLLECIKIPVFVKLYYGMYTYLNCIQKDQTIALIVSGGNLVTLFAKLLHDIYSKTSSESLIVEYREILGTVLIQNPGLNIKALLAELKTHIESSDILRALIPIVQAMFFGDLDFKLITVTTMVDYEFTDIETLYDEFMKNFMANVKEGSIDAQFFLGRKKITPYKGKLQPEIRMKLKTDRKQYEIWLKQGCDRVVEQHGKGEVLKGKLDKELLNNIFPSQMQDKYLLILSELRAKQIDPDTIKYIDNCYKYLSFLSYRKAMNELGTRDNINKISKNPETGVEGDPSQFITALRYYTSKGNAYSDAEVTPLDIRVDMFTSFHHVMTSKRGFLPKLVASLLNLFLTDTKLHPDFVSDYEPAKLEESKVTYDYSKTKNSKSYEGIMIECKARINLENKRGFHFVFLGLDAKNETDPIIKKPGIPINKAMTIRKKPKKLVSFKSTKPLREYVSSLLRTRSQIIPSIDIDIEPDDSVYEFSDNILLPEDIFDSDNPFLDPHASLLDNAFPGDILGSLMPETLEALMPVSSEAPSDEAYILNFPEQMSAGENKTKKSRKPKKSRKSRKARKPKKSRKSKKPKKSRKARKPKKSRKVRKSRKAKY